MAALRILIVLAICLYSALAQQCDQAVKDFHDCLEQSAKRPGGGQGGQKPDFEGMKQKAEACFTSNGCTVPSPPGGKGGQGGQQGGRAGRVGGSGAGSNDDRRKCFESVNSKTKAYILSCVQKSDPTFTFPSKGNGKGPQGDHHGPEGGFGGQHEGGEHEGGPGRGGPGQGFGGKGGQQFLLQACNNNADNANKVNACLANAFPRQQKPDTAQMKQEFDARCAAKSACQAKLGAACQAVLDKRAAAMCQCGQEVASQRQQFQSQEPACANLPQRQGGDKDHKQRDCSKKQDPCAQGFDAMMAQRQQGRQGQQG